MRVTFIRHGQSIGDVDERGKRVDFALAANGVWQHETPAELASTVRAAASVAG